MTPWYRNTIEIDRTRIARVNALIEGRPAPQSTAPQARIGDALLVAMIYDADLFRTALETSSLLALPQEVMARPGMADGIMEVAGGRGGGGASRAVSRAAVADAGIAAFGPATTAVAWQSRSRGEEGWS